MEESLVARPHGLLRLAIVDPSPWWRRGLELLFGTTAGLQVIAATEPTSMAELAALTPDIVVIHQGGQQTGSEAQWRAVARAVHSDMPAARIVGVHASLSVAELASASSDGFDSLVDEASGEAVLVRAVIDPAQRTLRRWEAPRLGPLPLTARELEVLQLLARGHTSRHMAEALGVSHRTIENHKQRVFRRLGVQSQSQAVATAIRLGLLTQTEVAS